MKHGTNFVKKSTKSQTRIYFYETRKLPRIRNNFTEHMQIKEFVSKF